ncbi:GNAT family N-acetyltransferase [Xenorhabdus bovienii]|uniref:GNAT family N-acetyltransferase n=1 Tax=Xenorhabdus bovienii TaxID=40576 RepID=UPI0023B342A1|nr:GNAT family N-acetyltransferase [Xenorhabdus bovienii]MDE9444688.1 GNAT family N-acetyltransferase [Xenorhabdus bovienii]
MSNEHNIYGRSIYFELANEHDAEFILDLRMNNKFNQFLSQVSNDLQDQTHWLKKYKEREKQELESYYIIKRIDNNSNIGTVRLYDFLNNPMSFCWGSWILNEQKTPNAAIESALLVYKIAFENKNFEQSHFDVRKENEKVISFHRKLGAELINEDDLNYYFIYKKETYHKILKKYSRFI